MQWQIFFGLIGKKALLLYGKWCLGILVKINKWIWIVFVCRAFYYRCCLEMFSRSWEFIDACLEMFSRAREFELCWWLLLEFINWCVLLLNIVGLIIFFPVILCLLVFQKCLFKSMKRKIYIGFMYSVACQIYWVIRHFPILSLKISSLLPINNLKLWSAIRSILFLGDPN